MFKMAAWIALALSTCFGIPQLGWAQNSVTIKYDKFQDRTTIHLQQKLRGPERHQTALNDLFLVAIIDCLGETTGCEDEFILMYFHSVSRADWSFLRLHEVRFLADGLRILPGTTQWDGDPSAASSTVMLYERTAFLLSAKEFKKLVNAKSVSVQYGIYEFDLLAAEIATLKQLVYHLGATPTLVPNNTKIVRP